MSSILVAPVHETAAPPDDEYLQPWMRALGRRRLPERIELEERLYTRLATFKHDFFAVTALYEGPGGHQVVLKVGRQADLFGFPMAWLGIHLAKREAHIYRRLAGTEGVPAFRGRWGPSGIVHDFVPGDQLKKGQAVDERFFPELDRILRAIHAKGFAYVDMNKRENILVDDRGRPHLIDFQISWRWNRPRWLLRLFQWSDRYHLMKHWRRHRPDQLTPGQIAASRRKPSWIRLHAGWARPLIRARRWALGRLSR